MDAQDISSHVERNININLLIDFNFQWPSIDKVFAVIF